MHLQQGLWVRRLSGALALVWLAGVASAEVDERLKPLLEKMEAFLKAPRPVFLRQQVDAAVNGVNQEQQLQEVWVRDLEHLRLERSDGTVVVMTPESIDMYIGPPKVLLHIPQETLQAMGEQRGEALRMLGINPPAESVHTILRGADHLPVTGEDRIGDEDCWVVTADKELFPEFRRTLAGVPEGFDLKTVQLALGRETGASRCTYFELGGPAQLEISVTVEEFAEDAEVTDEMLTFQTPDDALVLTWTPEKMPRQMRDEFDAAIAARVK